MRVLITGACGHIGSQLIRSRWLASAEEVILVDNMLSQRYSSLFALPADVNFRFIEQDFIHLPSELFTDDTIVIHLAAITNAEQTVGKESETWAVNSTGTKVLAIRCYQNGSKLIFPSTTSVYGSQEETVDETCTELVPQSPYAASKLAAEQYLQWAHVAHGLKCCILRFGTVVGWSRGMRFHTAVNKFIWQACTKQPITVWKTAWNQKRPYLSLKDAIRAIQFIAEGNMFDGELYNVVSQNLTIKSIVVMIEAALLREVSITHVDSPIMNQLSYTVSHMKISEKGCWASKFISEDIQETVTTLVGVNTWSG